MKGYMLDLNRSITANKLLFSKSHVKYHHRVIVKQVKEMMLWFWFLKIVVLYGSHCNVTAIIEQVAIEIFQFSNFYLMKYSTV